jgi:hypothetical protein
MNSSAQREQPVRAEHEYAALTGFLGQANGFRFTVLGLFLTAAGFVLQQPGRWTALLVFVLSVLLWLSELRTRAILHSLMARGRRLEGVPTDNGDEPTEERQDALPFVHALATMKGQRTWLGPPPRQKGVDERRAFPLPTVVSHTMMIDLIYFVVGVYCLLVVFVGPESFQSQSD